ncbi:helix-turn-helix domain-containing protein [Rossellomorea marisflavi]|uniref:helix-turn-helix domain-containing protein n=1 Tax=Rossellomorea marisflavi TaxID=189381 RepID=UPI0034582AB1
MDYSIIGKKIRELRKAIGITQGELADGICTQALVSRMEKGDIYPSATVLYRISQKLGVDVNYFFEIGSTERFDYIKNVERLLNNYRFKLQYDELIELVRKEEKNPIFINHKENKQLLEWNKAIYIAEVENDKDRAISVLLDAYQLTADQKRAMSEREMRLQLSLGNFLSLQDKYEEALAVYERVQDVLGPNPYLQDKSIQTRIYYHTARILTRLGRYDESMEYCKKGLKWTIGEERLFGIADLFYQIGFNLEMKGELEASLPYFQKARNYFHIQKNTKFVDFIDGKIGEVEEKLTVEWEKQHK